ncbi:MULTISPECIES: HIT family protein [unclassified Acinetobacter]|uniref:HIT family protein n=1 Tax=unclassified Acinetobacter TaxID=196816 RepID=UPI0018A91C4E|nr:MULTISPECIES: HIT family protein [unclassified Acinetobacter]MBJ9951866.1 HIT family protein [Acinetobacter baumannii]
MTEIKCPYCEFEEFDIIDKNEFGAILPEQNPLSKGHSVIIPLRHIDSFFEVSEKERKSLSSLLELARNELKIRHQPEGFHITFNDGNVFGEEQNKHFHIHIIPRYKNEPLKLDQRWGIINEK